MKEIMLFLLPGFIFLIGGFGCWFLPKFLMLIFNSDEKSINKTKEIDNNE